MKENDFNYPRIGCAGIIENYKGEILLGHRISKHGYDSWSLPGGHLELFESPFDCIKREIFEETGLKVIKLQSAGYTNDYFIEDDKHYITLFFNILDYDGINPIIKEPDKCSEWKFFKKSCFPENLFLPLKNYLDGLNKY